uniref:Uncharacterized protein n=1 Tax=Meloidogyne enterolobii TaxID=390850 RepID=A0A6V7Y3Q3_MELEN|nr:unnamed protein product [Meloidogyne enterolobii]
MKSMNLNVDVVVDEVTDLVSAIENLQDVKRKNVWVDLLFKKVNKGITLNFC